MLYLTDAVKPDQLIESLDLRKLMPTHRWHIQGTCAVNGDGIYEGVEALARLVKDFQRGHYNHH
ncbi:MAG: hypothetical protein GXO35_02535 [Gammaproteobacteria bacterium]|nr:hypothetical protein [Gammaproteobacteria bacterium]